MCRVLRLVRSCLGVYDGACVVGVFLGWGCAQSAVRRTLPGSAIFPCDVLQMKGLNLVPNVIIMIR